MTTCARARKRVQPQLRRTSYFGFSFGGVITANLANRYRTLHLPKPRAILLEDPHDGGLDGFDEPAVDDSLRGIPATVKLQCHSSAQGVISEPDRADGSCNAIFPKLGHIPTRNKDLVLTAPDAHGTPALSAPHGVCAARKGLADAYDWNFCWKAWDALRDCAYFGTRCNYALGDTPRAPLQRPLERRRPDRPAENSGRRADPALTQPRAGGSPRSFCFLAFGGV